MVPSLTVDGLTVEVHKLFLQSQKDQEHFDATTAQINDHATLIDENYKRLRDATDQLQRDQKQVAAEVVDNDAKLKVDLQQLESVVTGQGNRTMTLTEEVRQAITEVVGAQSGPAHNDQINARLGALDTKIEQTIGEFFQAIQEIGQTSCISNWPSFSLQ